MRCLLGLIGVYVFLIGTQSAAQGERILIYLVDEQLGENAWQFSENGGFCSAEMTSVEHAPSGANAVRWSWNIPEESFAGWGLRAVGGPFDLSPYLDCAAVAFMIKGVSNHPEIGFKIEDEKGNWTLWRMGGRQSPVEMSPHIWKRVILPLRKSEVLGAGVDPKRIRQIVFEAPRHAGTGDVLIDAAIILAVDDMKTLNYVKSPETALGSKPIRETKVIDDFQDRDILNVFSGKWGTFAAGDKGDIQYQVVEIEPGNNALECKGVLPDVNGSTWGGVFCDLSPNRTPTRDLSEYRDLEFKVRTDHPGIYLVRIENPTDAHNSTNVSFEATQTFKTVTIPLEEFVSGVKFSSTIVWRLEQDIPGNPFHLVLDDVRFGK